MKNPDTYEKEDRNRSEINFKPLTLPSISVPAGKLKPFTFEHFVAAMNGMKDEFLMPYIDYAIGIYCKIRNIRVEKPDKVSEYAGAYADAYEIALNAVYIAATKMSGFDPDKGQFKSYLSKSIHSALVDLLKADGYGDFFDQTSKKKNKDDEPEKHTRVDADCYWRTSTESELNPDDSESERERRIQKHENDALEVVIKYIDSLPEIQRAAIYASATGKILRPDLENYGRDYSEILAEKYNTTASYIRKLATEGKKKAVEEARRQGFNEESMRSVSTGFLQVKKDTSGTFDKVLSAIDHLEPCQQFMLLRHLANSVENDIKTNESITNTNERRHMTSWGGMIRRSNSKKGMREEDKNIEFLVDYLNKKIKGTEGQNFNLGEVLNGLSQDLFRACADNMISIEVKINGEGEECLSSDEKLLLQACTLLNFKLGQFKSIEDLLEKLDVKVIINPGIIYHVVPSELYEEKEYWEREVDRLKIEGNPAELQDAKEMLEYIIKEIGEWKNMKLRGCYEENDGEKRIILYPDEMRTECNDISWLLVSTLAHEAMHAYFDRPPHSSLPSVYSVEEPMAEFGMLLFLYETHLSYFKDAENDVCSKRSTPYRYGYALLQQHLKECGGQTSTRKDMELYKRKLY